jgi:hypothetical protein
MTDPDEIAGIAAFAEPMVAAAAEEAERSKAEFMAMSEDELFAACER